MRSRANSGIPGPSSTKRMARPFCNWSIKMAIVPPLGLNSMLLTRRLLMVRNRRKASPCTVASLSLGKMICSSFFLTSACTDSTSCLSKAESNTGSCRKGLCRFSNAESSSMRSIISCRRRVSSKMFFKNLCCIDWAIGSCKSSAAPLMEESGLFISWVKF